MKQTGGHWDSGCSLEESEIADFPRVNSREYDAAIKDAIIWLVQNNQKYKPEFLAGNMADDLLSDERAKP